MKLRVKKLLDRATQTGPLYTISSIWLSVITIITGILVIRWIPPDELGFWQSISVIQLYTPILDLGVTNGLNRELPFLVGRGENEKGIRYAQSAQAYSITSLIIVVVLFLGVLMYFSYVGKPVFFRAAVFAVGLISAINIYSRYLTVTFRSSQSFRKLAKIQFFSAGFSLISLPFVYYLGYYGLIFVQVVSLVISTSLMHFARPIKQMPKYDRNILDLIKTGLPVFIMGYVRGITASYNRLIILWFSNVVTVGLFAPVSAISSLNIMPKILGNYFFPKMNVLLGKTDDKRLLWPIALKINKMLFVVGLILALSLFFLSPYLIPFAFPKYVSSVPSIQVMSACFLFSGTLVSHNVLYAVKDYQLSYMFSIIECTLLFIIPFSIAKFSNLNILISISMGTVIVQIILFILNLIFIRRSLFKRTHTDVSN